MDTVGTLLTQLVGQRALFAVALRAKVSPFVLQQYLSDDALPSSAGPLEAIGHACEADDRQLTALVEAWYAQTHPERARREQAPSGAARRGPAPLAPPTGPALLPSPEAVLTSVPTEADPRWAQWAWTTAPSDRGAVESGIRECYRLDGRVAPPIVWADSPYTGVLLRRLTASLYFSLPAPLWNRPEWERDLETVRARQPDELRARISWELRELLGVSAVDCALPSIPLEVGSHLELAARTALVATDAHRVREALESAVRRLPRPRPRLGRGVPPPADRHDRYFHLDGQSLAPWIDATTRVVETLAATGRPLGDLPARLTAYREANAAGPWWPGGRLVIVSERPVSIEPGPLLRWADGTAYEPFGN